MSSRGEIAIRIKAHADMIQARTALGGLGNDFKSFTSQVAAARGSIFAATAAIGAAVFAMKKSFDFIEAGANIERQRVAFENLAASHRASSNQILYDLQRVSRGTVDTMSLMNTASKALVLGIGPDRLKSLMEIARAAAKATGDTITKSFNDIVTGLARQSKLILDNLGIVIDVSAANREYAMQLGKTASALSEAEKRQAFLNATLKAGQEIVKSVGEDFLSNADRVDVIKTNFVNAKNAAAEFFAKLALGNQTRTSLDAINIAVQDGRMSIQEAEAAYDRLIAKVTQTPAPMTMEETLRKSGEERAQAMAQLMEGLGVADDQALGRAQQLITLIEEIEERNRGLAAAGEKVFMSQSRLRELFQEALPEIKQGFDLLGDSERKAFLAMHNRLGITAQELENVKALQSTISSGGDRLMSKDVGPDDLFGIGDDLERKTRARNARLVGDARQSLTHIQNISRAVTDSMQQGFEGFFMSAMNGFRDFESFTTSLLTSIQRSIASVLGGLATSSLQQGLTHYFPALGPILGTQTKHQGGIIMHRGGIVPRFHAGGLASDERPAVLQTGEGVLSRKGMNAFDSLNQGKAPGGGEDQQIVIVNMIDPGSIVSMGLNDPVARGIVINHISADTINRGTTFKTLRRGL